MRRWRDGDRRIRPARVSSFVGDRDFDEGMGCQLAPTLPVCPVERLHLIPYLYIHFSLDSTHPPILNQPRRRAFRYIRSRPNKRRNSLRARPPPMRRDDPHYPGNDRRYEDLSEGQIPLTESLLDCMERGASLFSLFWGCTLTCRPKVKPLVVYSPRRILHTHIFVFRISCRIPPLFR